MLSLISGVMSDLLGFRLKVFHTRQVGLVHVPFQFGSSKVYRGSIRDDAYWISRKNSLELIELSSINKVSLV